MSFLPASLALLARRPELVEMVICWKRVKHPKKGIDYRSLSASAGVDLPKARQLVDVLVAHGLVEVGGGVPDDVWACVVEIAAEKIKTAAGRNK